MKLRLLSMVGILGATACATETRTETWEVAAHLAPCVGGVLTDLCLVVKRPGSSSLQLHYFGIDGFTPQWGHEYTVDAEITVSDRPHPYIADFHGESVTLRAVRRDEPVAPGTTFRFRVFDVGLGGVEFLSLAAAGAGELLDGTPFTCPAGSGVCEELGVRMASGEPFEITFAHGDGALTALAVADSPTPSPLGQ